VSNDKARAESVDSIMKDLPMVIMPAHQIPGQTGCSFKVMVRRSSDEDHIKDLNGRTLRIEPLATVNAIEDFLRPLVVLPWFERPRKDVPWLLALANKCKAGGHTFTHASNFDCNGLIYFIGSNGGSSPWVNPCRHNLITIASSDGVTLPVGKLEDILSRNAEPHNCCTENRPNSWFAVDLGVRMVLKRYTLRHGRGHGTSQAALRNWELQGSKVKHGSKVNHCFPWIGLLR
jgi:E3 ubiquitin-protein ligase HECTD1